MTYDEYLNKPGAPTLVMQTGRDGMLLFEKAFVADYLKQVVQPLIDSAPSHARGTISDGYHTFDELYEFRKLYNAALFNSWGDPNTLYYYLDSKSFDGVSSVKGPKYDVHKSWKHHDGELCFGGGWFIVVAMLPGGQISNHYKAEDWDLFKIPEAEKAKYEYDGHTSADVIQRLKGVL